MSENKIKIVSENGITKVFQNEIEIKGIKSVSFVHSATKDNPELQIIFSNDGVEIDTDIIPELPEFYHGFYERKSES